MAPELPDVQFLQTVVLYSILVCFLIAYQKTGRVLHWWSPHWQKPFHPLLHSSSVKFIHIGKIPLASMICPPGFQPQDEKPLAFSWSIKNNCSDALREQPSRWGTMRTKRCWRTPHTEDTGSPEAGGAVSLCEHGTLTVGSPTAGVRATRSEFQDTT